MTSDIGAQIQAHLATQRPTEHELYQAVCQQHGSRVASLAQAMLRNQHMDCASDILWGLAVHSARDFLMTVNNSTN